LFPNDHTCWGKRWWNAFRNKSYTFVLKLFWAHINTNLHKGVLHLITINEILGTDSWLYIYYVWCGGNVTAKIHVRLVSFSF
jgi:hypothetical protein